MIFESCMKKIKPLFFENSMRAITSGSYHHIQKRARSIFVGILILSVMFFFNHLLIVHPTFAFPTLEQSIQQFQKSLESSINKEIQSIHDVTQNITNCSNNVSIQTQTNNIKNSSIYFDKSCSDNFGFPLISNDIPIKTNLSGNLTSAEYDIPSGTIVSSVFGNWSLKSNSGSGIDFKAYFKKEPLIIDLTNQSLLNGPRINNSSNLSSSSSQNHSATLDNKQYNFSNFRVSAIMQQNSDITYEGTIDATENNVPSDSSNQTNSYNDLHVSISVLSGRVLVINFEDQDGFPNEFRNIPLVGLVG